MRGLVLLVLVAAGTATAAEGEAPRRSSRRPSGWNAPDLKAAHEDVERIKAGRRPIPPLPGWTDFRAILHAHAEDSAHTGGTLVEMTADAHAAGVNIILLSDHYRPPREFLHTRRGLYEGVFFLPGSEDRGFLIHPTSSVLGRMTDPTRKFIEAVRGDGGLIFLSHVEERPDHPMDGLDGMEITNRHADAKLDRAGLVALFLKLTDPAALADLQECARLYPDELYASQFRYPADYLAKWDAESNSRRLTGVGANDCHHNNVLLVKVLTADSVRVGTNVDRDEDMRIVPAIARPGLREMIRGHDPGDVIARVDLDPYAVSFRNLSTHILAPWLDESSLRIALRSGRVYVSHDWMCDPTGFRFGWTSAEGRGRIGDEVKLAPGLELDAWFPAECHIRLLRGGRLVAESTSGRMERPVEEPGVYRVEGWLTVDGEERPWIYSNPIYVR